MATGVKNGDPAHWGGGGKLKLHSLIEDGERVPYLIEKKLVRRRESDIILCLHPTIKTIRYAI